MGAEEIGGALGGLLGLGFILFCLALIVAPVFIWNNVAHIRDDFRAYAKQNQQMISAVLESLYRIERMLDPDKSNLSKALQLEEQARLNKLKHEAEEVERIKQANIEADKQRAAEEKAKQERKERRTQEKAERERLATLERLKGKEFAKCETENAHIVKTLEKLSERFAKHGGDIEDIKKCKSDLALATDMATITCPDCDNQFGVVGVYSGMKHVCPNCHEVLEME